MEVVFEKPIKLEEVLAINLKEANAVKNPTRATILDLLLEKPLSINEIVKKLAERGLNMAPTTVRHHVGILKDAGLVELAKVANVRGGVLKYYASNTKVLGYEEPPDFDENLADAIHQTGVKTMSIIEFLVEDYGKTIVKVAERLKPCPHCTPQHFLEFVILRILRRAMATVTREEGFKEMLKKLNMQQ